MSLERGGFDCNIAMHEDDLVLLIEALDDWNSCAATTGDVDRVVHMKVRAQDALVKVRRRKAGRERVR